MTMPLTIGAAAPDFTLPASGNHTISLSQYQGKQKVVLYFYPKDDTSGCTTEAKDFRDAMAQFEAAGVVVLGLSKDTATCHDKFIAKHELNFHLLSDEQGEVCESYGVWVQKSMYGKTYMGIQRATFLIDKQGKIAALWPKVSVTGHAQEVLKAAQAA